MRFEGRLASWNDDRGFGFITPAQGGQEIFVHIKSFPPGVGRPQVDQALSFEVELNAQGKKGAKNVQWLRAARRPAPPRGEAPAAWSLASRVALPAFALAWLAVAVVWGVSTWALLAYGAMSVVCYGAYTADKWAAQAGRWRMSENTLLGLGLACGWPGGLIAQQVLRHKTSKASFRSAFWVTVVLNVLAFVLLHGLLAGALRPG